MEADDWLEKRLRPNKELIAFGDDELERTSQPYDETLVVASRIEGFLVKRVLIDQ